MDDEIIERQLIDITICLNKSKKTRSVTVHIRNMTMGAPTDLIKYNGHVHYCALLLDLA